MSSVIDENQMNVALEASNTSEGHFLGLLDEERNEVSAFITKADADAASDDVLEEAKEVLRVATGKARLLLEQKFYRMMNLCECQAIGAGDAKTVTDDELAGFWSLVEIQIQDVIKLFNEVDDWRKNGWMKPETPKDQVLTKPKRKTGPGPRATFGSGSTSVSLQEFLRKKTRRDSGRQEVKTLVTREGDEILPVIDDSAHHASLPWRKSA